MSIDLVLDLEMPILAHGAGVLLGVLAFGYFYYLVKYFVSIVTGG